MRQRGATACSFRLRLVGLQLSSCRGKQAARRPIAHTERTPCVRSVDSQPNRQRQKHEQHQPLGDRGHGEVPTDGLSRDRGEKAAQMREIAGK